MCINVMKVSSASFLEIVGPDTHIVLSKIATKRFTTFFAALDVFQHSNDGEPFTRQRLANAESCYFAGFKV